MPAKLPREKKGGGGRARIGKKSPQQAGGKGWKEEEEEEESIQKALPLSSFSLSFQDDGQMACEGERKEGRRFNEDCENMWEIFLRQKFFFCFFS